jgi:two-component system sensor histidine kinase MprB
VSHGGGDDRHGPDHLPVTGLPVSPSGQVITQTLYPDGTIDSAPNGFTVPVEAVDVAVATGAMSSVRRDVVVGDQTFRMLTVPREGGHGAVQVVRGLGETERVLATLRWQIVLAVALVALISGLAGWLIARQLTERLERLTAAAEEVADTGRLDVDVPTDGSDETGRLGVAFASMLTALHRSREAQQRLVQDAGHELRTPLTSMRTNVSVLRRYESLPAAERDQVLVDLDAESRELSDLVNELVTLTSVGIDEEPVTPVPLGELAERVAERVRRRYGVDVSVESDEGTVPGRASALERAMTNLVDNAAKFGRGSAVQVQVSGGTVTVTDHGPGIPDADAPHVFDRFFRSDEARSMPGSGLGLAIVSDVVESHGGRVFAATDDLGTHVGFTLPRA